MTGLSFSIVGFALAVAGLTIPGYALARALRLKGSLAAAFPFSALLICQTVTALACTNGNITFANVTLIMAALTGICGVIAIKRHQPPEKSLPDAPTAERADLLLSRISITAAMLIIAAAAFRTTLYPLGGFDTFIRWDALAREMLQYRSLSFYPPLTAADFGIYTMPDGFPPLVASVYWWIYAATGSTLPQLTTLSVTLQFASMLGLAWFAAKTAFGRRAAAFTLLALTGSPLLIRSVEIGQESGFLAIAIAGQLCFALAALRKPAPSTVYAAALFAALGALAREYGPALVLPGLLILLSQPESRRLAWRYTLLAAVIASPWYIRNWIIAGSPLYPFMLPGSQHANHFLTALLNYYSGIFGINTFGLKVWLAIAYELIRECSVALLAGMFYLAVNGRRLYPYSLSLLLITFLWLWSIGKTSGGVIYSMRVLAPAVVILALLAGKALAEIPAKSWLSLILWALIPASLWGILSALSFPHGVTQLPVAIFSTKGEAPEFCEANRSFAQKIDELSLPATGILTDSPFLAVILKRETRFRPVVPWSSEVSAIISPEKSLIETSKLLHDKGISTVALNRTSLHNNLLFTTPFYRDGVNEWQELVQDGDWILFAVERSGGR